MTAVAVIDDLERRGVKLATINGLLRIDAPKGVLTAVDRAALAEYRDALIARLEATADIDIWDHVLAVTRWHMPAIVPALETLRARGTRLFVRDGTKYFGPFDDFTDSAWSSADDWRAEYVSVLGDRRAAWERVMEDTTAPAVKEKPSDERLNRSVLDRAGVIDRPVDWESILQSISEPNPISDLRYELIWRAVDHAWPSFTAADGCVLSGESSWISWTCDVVRTEVELTRSLNALRKGRSNSEQHLLGDNQ